MEGIVLGKRYFLSFKNKATDPSLETENAVTTLQYVFKPSSIDVEKPGTVTVSDTNEVLIALPTLDASALDETADISMSGGIDTESFKGIATKPLNECILSFDGDRFTMEKVTSAVVNIRHSRNESTFSTKDSTIGNARKFHEKTLLLRAGSKATKKTKPSNLTPKAPKAINSEGSTSTAAVTTTAAANATLFEVGGEMVVGVVGEVASVSASIPQPLKKRRTSRGTKTPAKSPTIENSVASQAVKIREIGGVGGTGDVGVSGGIREDGSLPPEASKTMEESFKEDSANIEAVKVRDVNSVVDTDDDTAKSAEPVKRKRASNAAKASVIMGAEVSNTH